MSETPKLIWLDLETTGLDPKKGEILEVGIIVTELDLTEKARMSWILPHVREDILVLMDDYVLEMHMTSGLLKEVWACQNNGQTTDGRRTSARNARDKIWQEIQQWIRSAVDFTDTKLCYLAGSSIHFDKAWLWEHYRGLLKYVSYRMLDVSSYKVAFPGLLREPEGEPAHRALDDLEYSIDQHRQMRNVIYRERMDGT